VPDARLAIGRLLQDVRSAAYFGLLTDPNAGFACGSMVRFDLVHTNIHKVVFYEQDRISSVLLEAEIPSESVTA